MNKLANLRYQTIVYVLFALLLITLGYTKKIATQKKELQQDIIKLSTLNNQYQQQLDSIKKPH